MDKLKQIEAFIAVVEHGSMAAAALTQDVTPVMIGRRINALEARLGVKLLHRSTRRIAVTEQGAVFMEQCKKALGELDRAELLVAEGRLGLRALPRLRLLRGGALRGASGRMLGHFRLGGLAWRRTLAFLPEHHRSGGSRLPRGSLLLLLLLRCGEHNFLTCVRVRVI